MALANELTWFHEIDVCNEINIQEKFTGLPINGYGNSGPDFRTYLSNKNRDFSKTQYYYQKSKEFIHFTNIKNLMSLIDSKCIRMYNMINSMDEGEYKFVGDILVYSDNYIKFKKERLFTFSFCETKELFNKKLWQCYGDGFQGAAVKFSFMNDINEWEKFHLSDIKYGSIEPFQKFRMEADKICLKFNIRSTFCDLSPIIGFHKSEKFAWEKEIRLLADTPFINSEEYYCTSADIRRKESGSEMSRYIEIPIWLDKTKLNSNEYLNKVGNSNAKPLLRIDKIYVTPKFELNSTLYNSIAEIRMIFKAKYGYDVPIEIIELEDD